MNRLASTVALVFAACWCIVECNPQPNVVIFYADDLGYGDLACYGHPTSLTPNLDRMSEEGLLFTQFYTASALCSPSRAALLTSRYSPRSGVYPGVFAADDVGGLPLNETTMAESLKSVGYSTAIVGKWHLGVGKDGMYLPTHQGFDYYIGVPYSTDMCPCDVCFYPDQKCSDPQNECINSDVPCPVFDNVKIIQQPAVKINLTEMYIDAATNFIKEKSEQSSPFLLYMAFQHTHKPQFSGKLATNSCIRGEFGDALAELDWGVGQILEELEKDGVSDNTFVFFTSDNGPDLAFKTHAGVQGPLRCGKASTWDGGQRVPGIAWWPGKIRHGRTQELAATLDLFPTVMKLAGGKMPSVITDGIDMSPILFENKKSNRQSFVYYSPYSTPQTGPYALRLGQYKAHFYTKGGSCPGDYPDEMCRGKLMAHSPPLLFNLNVDPSELYPLDPTEYADVLQEIEKVKKDFESTMVWGESQMARGKDPSYEPCASPGCSPFPSCCHT